MIWAALDYINHRLPKRRWNRLGNYICRKAT